MSQSTESTTQLAAERRYRHLFENTPVSIWEEDCSQVAEWFDQLRAEGVTDLRAHLGEYPEQVREAVDMIRVKDVNRATVEMFGGQSKAEIIERLPEMFGDEALRMFTEELDAMWRGENLLHLESTCVGLDGRTVHYLLSVFIERVDGGAIDLSEVIVAITDITARRQAESKLQFWQFTLDHSLSAVFWIDRSGRCLYANDAAGELLGYSHDELIQMTVFDFEPQVTLAVWDQRWAEIRREQLRHVETEIRCSDGHYITVDLAIHHVEIDGKQYHVTFVHDVTQRKRIEQESRFRAQQLRSQNAALRQLSRSRALKQGGLAAALAEITEMAARTLATERVSIWLYDDQRTKIHCHDLYELGPNWHSSGLELSAEQFPAYFDALERDRAITAHDARTDPRTSEFNETYLVPLGITSMMDAPILARGRTLGVVCHEHTQTPRRWTAEEETFAASVADYVSATLEADERQRLERELLVVAQREQVRIGQDLHDSLGQQLTGISFMAKVLQQKLTALELPEAQQAGKLVELIQDTITQSGSMARGLAPVELDAGGLDLALRNLVDHTERIFNIACIFHCSGSLDGLDRDLATQIYRIAQEAINNATKHASPHSLNILLNRTDRQLELRVADDGIGLPAGGQPAGMGLRIMQYRTDLIGGTLEYDSPAAGGTVVHCAVPLR